MSIPQHLTSELEHQCMLCDPFAGDFGDGERILSDKIVTTAKTHEGVCNICSGDIVKGTRSRSRVEANYGEVQSYRWCEPCCIAMAVSQEDSGDEWTRRVNLYD